MRKNLLLLSLTAVLAFSAYAYAATSASAQGPVFQGAPQVPSLNVAPGTTTTVCVGDGGFTNCVAGQAQLLPLAAPQVLLVNLDGGAGQQGVIFGSLTSALADAGVQAPNLTASSLLVCALENPVSGQSACGAQTMAPGGDGGVVVVTCGSGTFYGTDGGQATCLRLN